MYDTRYEIALFACGWVEPKTLRRLLSSVEDASTLWDRKFDWNSLANFQPKTIERVRCFIHRFSDVDRVFQDLEDRQIRAIHVSDEAFPNALSELSDPPRVLFTKGSLDVLARPTLAVVGTRRASSYALEAARWVSETCAQAGLVVCSGMALGVDGAAHQSSLLSAGRSLAVLGCGVDICYPQSHRSLYHSIIDNGCIVSEHGISAEPLKHRFPERNRIIAALSQAIVVVQAGERSGALRTVDAALELGRDVYVVPGPITSKHFRGSNRLLHAGAIPLIDPLDMLVDLGAAKNNLSIRAVGGAPGVPARWCDLYDALTYPLRPSVLSALLEKPVDEVYAGLLELELSGLVSRAVGGTYQRRNG